MTAKGTGRATHNLLNDDGAASVEDAFRAETPRLMRYFRLKLGRSGDIADLVQETFARLLSRTAQGAVRNPRAYLNRIARHLVFEQGRRKQRGLVIDPYFYTEDSPSMAPTQHQHVESSQMMDKFRIAFERLPPRTKEVFNLHHGDDLAHKEIAERLEISVRTVEWHMEEALLRLRRMMDE